MKHLVTALIITVIFVLAFVFGAALVESKVQAYHAVTGTVKSNIAGIVFLSVAMTGFACFASYMTILVRYDS